MLTLEFGEEITTHAHAADGRDWDFSLCTSATASRVIIVLALYISTYQACR